jgi:hypothetical protein
VLEASRKKEAEVRKDTMEQLDAFRRRREEDERKALEAEAPEGKTEEEAAVAAAHWVAHGRKRKKGPELLKGVKLRKAGEAADDKKDARKSEVEKAPSLAAPASKGDATALTSSKASAALPSKPSKPVLLDLGYASSDDDD